MIYSWNGLINQRLKQIDKNADSMNNGMVVSEERSGLTKEQARNVSDALKKGGTVVIPNGSPRDAVDRFPAAPLPADLFNQLQDTRYRLKDVFGVRGLNAAGLQQDDTVRGKLMTKNVDTDRIGGGVTEYLEQFADDICNWFVQLMYVYYEEFQTPHPKVVISVKEGSLLPKDTIFQANQAIELASHGMMSLLDLYKKLEDPNPEERAANAWLEKNAPQILYGQDPRIQQVMQQMQVQAQQQAQMQAQQQTQQSAQEHHQNMEGKQFDHQSKMQQQLAKTQSNQLLRQVPTQ